jgi:hypothetical protein
MIRKILSFITVICFRNSPKVCGREPNHLSECFPTSVRQWSTDVSIGLIVQEIVHRAAPKMFRRTPKNGHS